MGTIAGNKEWKRGVGLNPYNRKFPPVSASEMREIKRIKKRNDRQKTKKPPANGFG